MSGDIPIQSGEYKIDNTTWFDVRLADAGLVLSLCDLDMNIRYTVVIDKGQVIHKEVESLVADS